MNRDWQKLKKSENGVPVNEALIPYILEILKSGEELKSRKIKEHVIKFLEIPESILAMKYPNYPDSDGILLSRFNWALSSLYIANLVERPRRGVYRITESGLAMLDKHGDKLTKKMLEELPAFKERRL